MRTNSGGTHTVWVRSNLMAAERGELDHDVQADVCIVGAGIAGLSVAYHLVKEGMKVVVLEDGDIGGGETCRTTAHLSNAFDDGYYAVEQVHGPVKSRLVAESHTQAIDRIEHIVKSEDIECDFERVDGYLFNPPDDPSVDLDLELKAARRAGLKNVEQLELAPIMDFHTGFALRFPDQAQFHVMKYLLGLAGVIRANGGLIYTNTHATSMKGGTPAIIKTEDDFQVTASALVVATNVPVNDWIKIHAVQTPYRSYVIGAHVPKGSVTRALYWDTGDPYHYVRLQNAPAGEDHEILIVGGEDHRTGQKNDAAQRFLRLEAWARERWPQIESIEFRWSGQVIEPHDYIGFIGRNPLDKSNVFICTGDSGMGMTHGTIAGMLISDLILERENPWEKLYNPDRINMLAADELVKDNLNTLIQYKDHLTPADADNVNSILPGEGALIRHGISKVAIYKDLDGSIHECSAVCPHLGAIVQWNALEKTWDCPAHGSRFDCYGKAINGPANGGLTVIEEKEQHKRSA